jgi:hypothetical protein
VVCAEEDALGVPSTAIGIPKSFVDVEKANSLVHSCLLIQWIFPEGTAESERPDQLLGRNRIAQQALAPVEKMEHAHRLQGSMKLTESFFYLSRERDL